MTLFAELAATLKKAGVRTAFSVPSVHNLGVLEALISAGIETLSLRSELGAAHAADGYARVSGEPTALVTSTGPGAGNAVGGFAVAAKDGSPVIHVATTNVRGNAHGLHHVPEQRQWMAAMGQPLIDLSNAPVVELAAAITRGGAIGVLVPVSGIAAPETSAGHPQASPSQDFQTAMRVLAPWRSAERPLLWIGGGARGFGTRRLIELAESYGAAVFTSSQGKDLFPSYHPNFVASTLREPTLAELAGEADVALALGSRLTEATTRGWATPFPSTILRVGYTAEVPPFADATVSSVAADSTAVGEWLLSTAPAQRRAFGARQGERARERRARIERTAIEYRYVDAIQEVLKARDVVVCDMTRLSFWTLSNLNLPQGARYLWPGLLSMGFGLPAALGASIAAPTRRVIAIIGDGGILSTLPELDVAAGLDTRLDIVLVDDDGYGVFRARVSDKLRAAAIDFHGPSWQALAEAFGLAYFDTGEDLDAFTQALRRTERSPALVRIDAHSFQARAK
jgi:acetolactate synthase-1/2/3 large subunit